MQFGDGYEQRISYGLNFDSKSWNLTFANRTDTERESILTFLEARAGSENFTWTPPRGTTAKYVCNEWNMEMINYNNNTITATFVEVFEP